MQGSIRGKTQWLYADPKQKRDLLLRARAKTHELHRLLLDTEAKHQILAPHHFFSEAPSCPPRTTIPSTIPRTSNSAAAAILSAVGTGTNLNRLFLSMQRWMWSADRVYKRWLSQLDMHATIRRSHLRWIAAEVFPTHAIEALLLDPHLKVSLLMDEKINSTSSQIPSPWLYVARKKTSEEKVQALVDGEADDRETGKINSSTTAASGKRASLPYDSLLEKRLSNEQQIDFIQNLPYRRCDTDDTGETTLGKHLRKPRRRGTSVQRAAKVDSLRQEGMPLAADGSVTTASCYVELTPSMGHYERMFTIASTAAYVIHSLFFDGRAVSVSTTSPEIATVLETVFGEFLDEQFLSVDLATARPTNGDDRVRPLAASSVWAVPEARAGANNKWTVAECQAVLEQAAATDCRSIIVPKEWAGYDELQRTADSMRSSLEQRKGHSLFIPTLYPSPVPVAELLQETTRVPYLTLLSKDTSYASRIAQGSDCNLHESVRVVGINAIACDAPLFVPGALSPMVGSGWRSTNLHEPTSNIGNSHRFESTARTVLERPWETQLLGWGRALSPTGRYDASNTPLTMARVPRLQGIVSERLCEALSSDFGVVPSLGLVSAKLVGV